MSKRIRILDIPVDMVTSDEALEKFKGFIEEDGCDLIVTPNSEIVIADGDSRRNRHRLRIENTKTTAIRAGDRNRFFRKGAGIYGVHWKDRLSVRQ